MPPSVSFDSWFLYAKRKENPKLRLFAFPFSGGEARFYSSWVHKLPEGVEVCAIQLPGRGSRINEPLHTRMDRLVQLLSFLIRPLTDIPYVFFGHSLGSLIAYELARTLQEQAAGAPERLFISACNPPRIVGAEREERSPLHLLNDDTLSNALRQMNGTPHEVLQNDELMKVFLPIIKADFEMIDTYEFREGVALRCPLTVFAGTEDPIVSIEWLPKWAECTSSHLNMHAITGGHFYLKENEELFFQMLNGELDELLTGIEGVASSHGK